MIVAAVEAAVGFGEAGADLHGARVADRDAVGAEIQLHAAVLADGVLLLRGVGHGGAAPRREEVSRLRRELGGELGSPSLTPCPLSNVMEVSRTSMSQ